MQKILLLLCLILISSAEVRSQTKSVVFFTDKKGTEFSLTNPAAYLSARAIARRTNYNILIDSTDIPVVQKYIDSVLQSGTVTLLGRLKWLNAIIIQTSDTTALSKINSFPFVKKVNGVALRQFNARVTANKFAPVSNSRPVSNRIMQTLADTFNYAASASQIKIHNGDFLHNIGARGQGMQIAFLDAGFTSFPVNHFFDSARVRNQFLGTWDFVQNDSSVEHHSHGLACFSIVGSYVPGTFVGSCPEAGYYLLRTEDAAAEQIIEEYNWALGAEYADSSGADVLTSSLGYTTFDDTSHNHSYADLDGKTTVAARMATIAARKGLLVLISAGNDGDKSWHYINTPADADSVLSVGAVGTNGIIAAFSSFGPSSDNRIKPDVVSVGSGTALSTITGVVAYGGGTSFSCPNLAGLATCLWQLFPEANNIKIINTIQKSSNRFATPHAQYGYGLPDMKKAVGLLLTDLATMNVTATNCIANISWSSKDNSSMLYNIERQLPGETGFTKIKTITANGISFSLQQYAINDTVNTNTTGAVFYRIKQVIDTSTATQDEYIIQSASVTISGCLLLNTSNTQNEKLIEIYPNPTRSDIILKFKNQNSISDLTIEVIAITGEKILTDKLNKPTGIFNHLLPTQSLPKGTYNIVVLKQGKIFAVKEFIKQ
ncbi:MAG: S8 family serine peptidase [Lacibacter sp.]